VPVQVHLQACPTYEREQVTAVVNAALAAAAPPELIRPGQRVLLKPNVINDMAPERAVCTHPEVVRAVAAWVLERGGEVLIADQPGYALAEEASHAFANTGMIPACEGLAVRFSLLSRGGYEEVELAESYRFARIQFARDVLRADVVINLPKAKTHSQTLYTGAVKNMFGAVAPRQRIDVHLVGRYWALSEAIVDCYAARPPQLHLLDAVEIMEGMGPTQGRPRPLGLLLASTDGVALDAIAARLMGFGPVEVATTVAAGNLNLGEPRLEHITVSGESVEQFAVAAQRSPIMRAEMLGPLMPLLRWLVTARPEVERKACRACGACAGICPTGAVTIEDYALIDRGRCVECFCCQEACPYDAITVRRPRIYRLAWHLKKGLDRIIGRPS
jgi:uncharacterized protein (DUF362 family)/Pyruvate/2-oxoacid:ferredoxin oxidoreductase delta subunit